ncbi:GNAT family N-acetyltransferase [Porphyrobacter sp. GA68]|uniref:GNAT family N-acetyltransferase n=1 Tax=Porphyrobacter sp. GA68 TaxID=2883480 RepID=UPI001D17DCC3|nr:GNAT family N-acetyltransferase [Porphyrobacter sp. GA68]
MTVTIRPAEAADLPALYSLVERAYRGEDARRGWTHEADLLSDRRTEPGELEAIVTDPHQALLMLDDGTAPLGCVRIADLGQGLAYLGLLCVEPARQGEQLGRKLMQEAERYARDVLACNVIEMTVIEQRRELIAYYERRGWQRTGERRDFPVPLDPPLFMCVLTKSLA